MSKFWNLLASGNDQQRFVRIAGIASILVYPSWSIIYDFVLQGQADDPIVERIIAVTPVFAAFLLSFHDKFTPYLKLIINLCIYVVTIHLFYLVFRNDVKPSYQIGMLVLVAALTPYFQSIKELSFYMMTLALLVGIAMFNSRAIEYWVFYGGVITVGLMSFLALNLRLKILAKLGQSRQKILERNQDIESILENINQGILPIVSSNEQLVIGADYSKFLSVILQKEELTDLDPYNEFFEKTDLNAEQLTNIKTILMTSIGEDEIQWETNLHMLPNESRLLVDDAEYDIEFEWTPVVDQRTGLVNKILVVFRDVTELKKMQEKSRDKDLDIGILANIVSVETKDFLEFCTFTKVALQRTANYLDDEQAGNYPKNLAYAFRELHTLKGLARSFSFNEISLLCHETEDILQQVTKQEDSSERQKLKPELMQRFSKLEAMFQRYLNVNKNILKRDEKQEVKLGVEFIEKHIKELKMHMKDQGVVENSLVSKFVCELESLYKVNLSGLLKNEIESLANIAKRLDKEKPLIELINDDFFVNESSKEALKSAFVHILRNSLDHGIERKDLRLEKGKNARGKISIEIINSLEGNFEVRVEDDGQGLNLRKIREVGFKKNLISANEDNEQRIADLIFHSEFSTASEVSEISGRGVGMDVVIGRLHDAGMKVELKLGEHFENSNTAFTIIIQCPPDTFVPMFENVA